MEDEARKLIEEMDIKNAYFDKKLSEKNIEITKNEATLRAQQVEIESLRRITDSTGKESKTLMEELQFAQDMIAHKSEKILDLEDQI